MNYLWNKHLESRETAEFLIKNRRYGPSIHCSYYSCYQLILCLTELHKQDIELARQGNPSNGSPHGSHNKTINGVTNLIKKRDSNKAFTLHQQIMQLKQLRVKADYENKRIDADDSHRASRIADSIIDQLTPYSNEVF